MPDEIILSTGRKVIANLGIIGIDPDSSQISGGYDDGIYYIGCEDGLDEEDLLTRNELCEIADIAIQRWNKFKEKIKNKIPN